MRCLLMLTRLRYSQSADANSPPGRNRLLRSPLPAVVPPQGVTESGVARRGVSPGAGLALGMLWLVLMLPFGGSFAEAQAPNTFAEPSVAEPIEVPVDEAMIQELLEPESPEPIAGAAPQPTGIDLLSLIAQGGGFMIPIGLMSLLVVTLAFERMLSLRRRRLVPPALVKKLQRLIDPIERFSPSAALAACREHPSAAATAMSAMLLRTGQPLADVERAATEAVQREADDQAAPIRWLSLAAAATPLMGLLGTVWGMIKAFHEATTLTPDRSRSEQLSEGIYTALVTTLAGLAVAIPAAILAQYLENRLAKHFHRIERLAFSIAPALVRFVGRARLDPDGTLHAIAVTPPKSAPPHPSTGGPLSVQSPPISQPVAISPSPVATPPVPSGGRVSR